DKNGAGWGWFVGPTPSDDSEFTTPGDQGERGRMDLLTVLEHEIGHLLGRGHEADGVMQERLEAGVREGATDSPTGALDLLLSHAAGVPAFAPPFWGDVLSLLPERKD